MGVSIRFALAQMNSAVGDIAGNYQRILSFYGEAVAMQADMLVLPELALVGYPADDMILSQSFLGEAAYYLQQLQQQTAGAKTAILLGVPLMEQGHIYNACCLLDQGQRVATHYKSDLPNYQVFDEKRLFTAGKLPNIISFRGIDLGVMICEEMWTDSAAKQLRQQGAHLLLVINSSPYDAGLQLSPLSTQPNSLLPDKMHRRQQVAAGLAKENGLPLLYVNQVGGQDDLVFDGSSFLLDQRGQMVSQALAFQEQLIGVDWAVGQSSFRLVGQPAYHPTYPGLSHKSLHPALQLGHVYQAAVLGLRDYIGKNKAKEVVLGLSGGIDSALTAAIAVDALGSRQVRGVMMPSPYTSQQSLEDAATTAKLLGIRLDQLPIHGLMEKYRETLASLFSGTKPSLAEENLQSRIRGTLLMAVSNKLSPLVLATGNKSEMAVGYATLYGDTCGAYAPLKDIYKTTIFALAEWRNQVKPAIAKGPAGLIMPERVLKRPPTAELRFDQKDEDSLPPYPILDRILQGLVEEDLGIAEIVAGGYQRPLVEEIWSLLGRAEYKRHQTPPGPRVSPRAFARERRYPITQGWIKRKF